MDKNQFEQLKKLVMDLDKSLTRVKSFIDQQETSANTEGFGDNMGFPPLPSEPRHMDPFSSRPAPLRSALNNGFNDMPKDPRMQGRRDPFATPGGASMPHSNPFSMPASPPAASPVSAAPRPVDAGLPSQKGNISPLGVTNEVAVPTTNTVLSPSAPPEITDEIEGTFDGQFLVTSTGQKVEVPANYASKTRVLYGDVVKAYKEGGEQKFKVTTKQPRKKLKALTTKREGKWHVVTGLGSYKISDSSADFNNLQLNQEVNVLVPESNTQVPYAAFDEIYVAGPTTVPTASPAQAPAPEDRKPNNSVPNTTATTPQAPKPSPKPSDGKNQGGDSKSGSANKTPNSGGSKPPRPPMQQGGGQTQMRAQTTPQQEPNASAPANIDPALRVVEDFDLV